MTVVEEDEGGVAAGVGSRSWQDELASLVETSGIQYPDYYFYDNTAASTALPLPQDGFEFGFDKPPATANGGVGVGVGVGVTMDDFNLEKQQAVAPSEVVEEESFRDQVTGFVKASTEMVTDLALGCKDVVHQILVAHGVDSYLMAKFDKVSNRLGFLNDYFLPEDRHPIHAWPIILFVFIIALAVLCVNTEPQIPRPMPKKVYIHPPSATLVQLPDGRHIAYHEQGVTAERARFSLVSPHSFLSSRLAGIPGIKESLLEEFGVRLITYDLPGFGESDPHPNRNLNTSAMDMLHIADSVGVNDKFWVVGYSGGGIHAWAALNYIPDRLAGAAMFSPFVNPYDSSMTKEECARIWEKWTPKRKLIYSLALRFPSLLTYIFRRSFLSGEHGQLDKWLALSLGKKDRALIEKPSFEEFWQRDVEESIRQQNIRPFVEEAYLQVSRWGFSLADIQVQKKSWGKGFIPWLKSMYSEAEIEWGGFLGPIHIWQGMEDMVVTPATAEFISRLVPGATIHKLPGEGHLSYFYFCDECHRQIFSTLFGTPPGSTQVGCRGGGDLSGGE